jgi:hypothetical protein
MHADLVLETDSILVFCVSKCSVGAYICLLFYVCSFFDGIKMKRKLRIKKCLHSEAKIPEVQVF